MIVTTGGVSAVAYTLTDGTQRIVIYPLTKTSQALHCAAMDCLYQRISLTGFAEAASQIMAAIEPDEDRRPRTALVVISEWLCGGK